MKYFLGSEMNYDKFKPILDQAIELISREESSSKKAEMLGWWTYYLTHTLISTEVPTKNDPEFIKELKKQADQIFSLLTNSFSFLGTIPEETLFFLAGNLNYCLSYVALSILKEASCGMRCYATQQIRNVAESSHLDVNQRLFVVVKGVVFDVLDEVYRKKQGLLK
jgi:hypothetical protein